MLCSLVLISMSRSPDVIFLAEKFFPTMDSSVLETKNGDSFAKGFSLSECITRNLGNFSAERYVSVRCFSKRVIASQRWQKVFVYFRPRTPARNTPPTSSASIN